jgi:hypothetical protein
MKGRAPKLALGVGILLLPLFISAPLLAQAAPQTQPTQPGNNPPAAPPDNLPNAPAATQTENQPGSQETKPENNTGPSLQDLGFPTEQTKPDPKMQALLDKRTHMLKIHQRMGLITTIPLFATLVTSVNAGGKNTSNTDRTVHTILGATTADLYFITAYYAIRAPRVPGTQTRGPHPFP